MQKRSANLAGFGASLYGKDFNNKVNIVAFFMQQSVNVDSHAENAVSSATAAACTIALAKPRTSKPGMPWKILSSRICKR